MAGTMYTITVEETGESFRCSSEETLLKGMEKLGRKGIPVGCREGGCGVCKVHVVEGTYVKRVMSREHVSAEDEAADRVLACRIRPGSDLTLRIIGKLVKAVVKQQPPVLSGKLSQGC